MKCLREVFEEELSSDTSFTVANGLIDIRGERFSAIEILRLASTGIDRSLSIQERIFTEWLEEYIERRIEHADEILERYGQVKLFGLIKQNHKKASLVPFVGAGLSRDSGYPGWADFLRDARKNTIILESDMEAMISNGQYELAAQKIYDARRHGFNVDVEATFGVDLKIAGPIRLLPHVFKYHVVTTNFDSVIERVYMDEDIAFDNVVDGSDSSEIRRLVNDARRVLLKLHGKALSGTGRILTQSEYDQHYVDGKTLKKTLGVLCDRYNILFLGCSLTVDKTLSCIKEHVDEIGHLNLPNHYAFLAAPDDDNERISRQDELEKYHIYPIWFPDGTHSDSIEAFLLKLHAAT